MQAIQPKRTPYLASAWLLVSSLVCTADARADSQALFADMLDTYFNATPGQVFETQRRGGVTLGSVSVRSRVVRPNVISMTPPSIRGDCSGIDAIGGSFSLLNGEQLQQFTRAIASNALNYAFLMGVEGVCPTCSQLMQKLYEFGEDMNGKLMDSCYWAKSLVDSTGLDDWHQSRIKTAQNRQVQAGVVEDAFEALQNFVSEFQADAVANQSTAVNAVWDVMEKSRTASWFGSFGDNELKEILMSVTGSVIKSPAGAAGTECANTDAQREYCFRELPPLLTAEHFVNGSDAGAISIYKCQDSYLECLDPVAEQRQWPGLKRRLREILFGPAPGYTGGLVYKLRNPADTYTEAEQRFLEGAPYPVYTLLLGVSHYEGSLVSMAERVANQITTQVARHLVLEMISTVNKSFSAHGVQMSAMMKQRLAEQAAEFQTRMAVEDREFDDLYKDLNISQDIDRRAKQRQAPMDSAVPAQRPRY